MAAKDRKEELRLAAELEARDARRAAREKKYQDNYLSYLDAVKQGEKRTFDQYVAHQKYVEKRDKKRADALKEQESITKRQQALDKKTRDLAKQHGKFLKGNSAVLLEALGIEDKKKSILIKGAQEAAKKALESETKLSNMKMDYTTKESDAEFQSTKRRVELNRAAQEGFNIAQEARKEAYEAMQADSFDQQSHMDDLAARLSQVGGLSEAVKTQILNNAREFSEGARDVIESAGGGEEFGKKFDIAKSSQDAIDNFEEKAFKIKSFFTDPKFRGVLMKAFFLGLAVKAATALADVFKGTFDLVTELGISFKSLPLAASLAADETKAMLNEFGSLNEVTSKQLLLMKLRSKLFGVEAADQAKILKLQTSITDQTKDMALKDQAMFMKDIRKQGLSVSKVMGDIASNADMFANFAKEGGKNIEEAAAAAAKMGLNLEATNSVAEKLLDFESSIAAEQEASMLLGRSVNLDKARQLAFTGDLAGMMEEVKRQAGGEAEFAKLNVIQRQALGDAVGLQGEQLATLLKDQEASTKEQDKGTQAVMMGVAAGALLGAVLGAAAVGFGGALWGGISLGAAAGAAIKSGLGGLGKGMLAGAGKGAVIGGGIGLAGGMGYNAFQGRERGGPVRAGNPYIVGEKRPELFIPTQSGHILPNVPGMANGTGFVQGDMSETNSLLKDSMILMEKLAKTSDRKRESAFANR